MAEGTQSLLAARIKIMRQRLEDQRWLCGECHENIAPGEEICETGHYGTRWVHIGCVPTRYAPTRGAES